MKKALFISLAIIWACYCQDPNPSVQNIHQVYSSGFNSVPLLKDDLGFYVNVHLTNNTNDTSSDTVPMELNFYTSYTLLFQNCLGYTPYNCSKYSCTENPGLWKDLILPSFSSSYFPADATLYLGSNNWESQSYIFIAYNCDSNDKWVGFGRSGMIGMLYNDEITYSKKFFSIYINQEKSRGELAFGFNPKYAQSKTPLFTVTTTDDGMLFFQSGYIQIGNSIYTEIPWVSYEFDLNSDSIGFPYDVYQNVIDFLETEGAMSCTDDINLPICLYQGKVKDLPTIFLHSQRADNTNFSVPIPPQVYVVDGQNDDVDVSTITLNIRALASNLTGKNYQIGDFDTLITLGNSFMSYYYVSFSYYNDSQSTYSFYLANHDHHDEQGVVEIAENLEQLEKILEEDLSSALSLNQALESIPISVVDNLGPIGGNPQQIFDSIVEFHNPEFRGLFSPF